jgi:hypothetical protein
MQLGKARVVAALVFCAVHLSVAQHTTLFTAPDPGDVRETDWTGVVAYTSFEETALSSTALGAGGLYIDSTLTADCNKDHRLLPNAGQAAVAYDLCTGGIYELGFQSYYHKYSPTIAEDRTEWNNDREGVCDGDDIGVVGDSTTSQGGGGGGAAPDGDQYYLLEDTGGGFAFVVIGPGLPGPPGPSRGVSAPFAFSTVNCFFTALLYWRAGRLTAQNGGFRPGQMLLTCAGILT